MGETKDDDPGLVEGDEIRLIDDYFGMTEDFVVERFRGCLGIFRSDQHRSAKQFTPLCELYERGPDSKQDYISNFGEYWTNLVPAWGQLPRGTIRGPATAINDVRKDLAEIAARGGQQ